MARPVVPLSDTKCLSARPKERDYKLFDGQGLHLLVRTNGSKTWRLKYTRPNGKEGLATFGSYPALSLKAARDRRGNALALLAEGKDPIEEARAEKLKEAAEATNTFKAVATEWHAAHARKWTESHAKVVWRRIELHLLPTLGHRPVDTLKARDLLAPLKEAEKRDALELASRLRQYADGIMRYAVQHDLIDSNPARDLVGAIATGKTTHRPALPLDRLPELLEAIDTDTGRPLTRLAVLLTLLVFIRSSELRFARWDEIDFKRAMWVIPAERAPIEGVKHSTRGSKMRTPHMVPLSRQAIKVLQEIHRLTGSFVLVFAGDHSPHKPMCENTINKALRRMGFDTQTEVCGHGFRTMACSTLVESGLWSRDAVERQMSHQERDGVRAAYIHKAEHLEERRLMMEWWGNYLDANRTIHITPYDFANLTEKARNVVRMRKGKNRA